MSEAGRRRLVAVATLAAALVAVMVAISLGAEGLAYLVPVLLLGIVLWAEAWGWRSFALLVAVIGAAFIFQRLAG